MEERNMYFFQRNKLHSPSMAEQPLAASQIVRPEKPFQAAKV